MTGYSRALATLGLERKAPLITSSSIRAEFPFHVSRPRPFQCTESRGCFSLESSAVQTCPVTNARLSCELPRMRCVNIWTPFCDWHPSLFCAPGGSVMGLATLLWIFYTLVLFQAVLEAEGARIFFELRGIAVCSVKLGTGSSFKRFCNISWK